MGKNNRQRRAAKQRQRQRAAGGGDRQRRPGGPPFGPEFAEHALRRAILGAADDHAAGVCDAARDCVRILIADGSPIGATAVEQVSEVLLGGLLDMLVENGWQPLDLREYTARKLGRGHLPVLGTMLGQQAAAFPASRVDPRWTAQLTLFGVGGRSPAELHLRPAGRCAGLDETTTLTFAIELLGLLAGAPKLPAVLAAPGTFTGSTPAVSDAQARVLARVRGLLAKAESTEYAEEAEALTAKAQDLMTRHSLQRLIGAHRRQETETVANGRIWLDPPYASAKSLLVAAVAEANRCQSVGMGDLSCVTVVGLDTDLAAVELLVTSLLVQATRSMVEGQPYAGRRMRSFRQSFLVAFANRIGERLRESSASATQDVADAAPAGLLPVLRAASARVDEAVAAAFPHLSHRRISANNGLGWAAGRAAADLARLHADPQLAPGDPRLADSA